MISRSLPLLLTSIVVVAATTLCSSSPAQTKSPAPTDVFAKKDDAADSRTVVVLRLRYAKSSEAGRMIEQLIPDLENRISSDDRTNSLIAYGSRDELTTLQELVTQIDTPKERDPNELTIFPDSQVPASDAVNLLRGLNVKVDTAATPDGLIILRGEREDVDMAGKLLETISKAQQKIEEDLVVEVLWLTESKVDGAKAFASEVAEKLHQRGFEPLSTLAHLEARTHPDGQCMVQSEAVGGTITCISQLKRVEKSIRLDMRIDASFHSEARTRKIEFESTVSSPLDRWIVFGVAQRGGRPESDEGMKRDVILLRLKTDEPL